MAAHKKAIFIKNRSRNKDLYQKLVLYEKGSSQRNAKGINVNETVTESIQKAARISSIFTFEKACLLAIKNMILVNPRKNMPLAIKKIRARMNSGGTIRFNFTG